MKDFLKKVLGKDEKFYELLEASADEAQKSAKSLSKLYAQVGKPDFEQCFTELVVARRVDKRIGLSITQELCKTFVTPLEREDIEALAKKAEEAAKAREKREQAVALLTENKEVKKFIDLLKKVEAKEIKMSPEQMIGWQAAQTRFVSVRRPFLQLDGEIRELAESERLYGEQVAALAAAKAEAAARLSCKLRAVRGETVVRTMRVHHGIFPLGDISPKEIHNQLRAHGSVEDKLFSGHSGTFSWPEV